MIKEINASRLEEELTKDSVLLNFYSEHCGACKMTAFILEDVQKNLGDQVHMVKVNYEEHQDLAEAYQVKGYPTLIHLKNGQEIARKEGLIQKTGIIKMIEENA